MKDKRKPLVQPVLTPQRKLDLIAELLVGSQEEAEAVQTDTSTEESLQKQIKCCFAKIGDNAKEIKALHEVVELNLKATRKLDKEIKLMRKYAQEVGDSICKLGLIWDGVRNNSN